MKIDKKDKNNNIIKSLKNEINLKNFLEFKNYDELWVIGGANIYDLFLNKTNIFIVKNIYVTLIDEIIECDTFFPILDNTKYCFISKSIHINDNNINTINYNNNSNSYNNINNKKYNLYDIIYSNN